LPMRPQVARKRLGVVGLGQIGAKIAQRGAAFDLTVGYHSRSARPHVPYRYFESLLALAEWCDFLVVLTPHIAGWSPESMQASLQCFLDNAELHFAGRPVRTPI